MTLVRRLLILFLVGFLLAIVTIHYLWPEPPFAGTYRTENKYGRYGLRLSADGGALMAYTDPKGKRRLYRGRIEYVEGAWSVTWLEQAGAEGDDWQPATTTVHAPVVFDADFAHAKVAGVSFSREKK